ncbi:MAG: DUF1292 domain-containing protein [Wujia sp.]
MNQENMQPDEELQEDYVDMVLDDGTELRCDVVAIFPVNGQQYIALLPDKVLEGYEEDEVFLYRYTDMGNDDIELGQIESDEEYEMVADAFDELLDNEAYEEM